MERGSSNLHQFRGADQQAKTNREHQILLNKYLELLKGSVPRKRKLKTVKQNRDNLLAQVKFLRRRRRYLLKHQSLTSEVDKVLHSENSDLHKPLVEGRRKILPMKLAVGKNSILRNGEGAGGRGEEKEIVQEALRVEKTPRNYFLNDKNRRKENLVAG